MQMCSLSLSLCHHQPRSQEEGSERGNTQPSILLPLFMHTFAPLMDPLSPSPSLPSLSLSLPFPPSISLSPDRPSRRSQTTAAAARPVAEQLERVRTAQALDGKTTGGTERKREGGTGSWRGRRRGKLGFWLWVGWGAKGDACFPFVSGRRSIHR